MPNPTDKAQVLEYKPTRHELGTRVLCILYGLGFFVLLATNCSAYTDEQLANAIFHAENSKSHPYGILAHYKHTTPRQACINTIRHAKKDWNGKGDFIDFLQKRYAPIGAKNDPRGLNGNWQANVRYWLRRGV